MTIIFCWSVSAVQRDHFSPGEPASRNVCPAGPRRWCRRGLQWKSHIWLHAQRLDCPSVQHPSRHGCGSTPFTHSKYKDTHNKFTRKHLYLIRLKDVECVSLSLCCSKTSKQQINNPASSDSIVREKYEPKVTELQSYGGCEHIPLQIQPGLYS